VGQLAQSGKYAARGSAECANHAIRIRIAVVRRRGDAAEGVNSCKTVAAGLAAGKKSKALCSRHNIPLLICLGVPVSAADLYSALLRRAGRAEGEKVS
jgi:hypothetical protein